MHRHTLRAASLVGLALVAPPLAAQSFISPACPEGSVRLSGSCVTANGTVVQSFDLPQIEQRQVFDLRSEGPLGITATEEDARATVDGDSLFITDLDADLTVFTKK